MKQTKQIYSSRCLTRVADIETLHVLKQLHCSYGKFSSQFVLCIKKWHAHIVVFQ